MIKEEDVFDALKKVVEPDLGKNIVELGLVTLVSSSDKSLSLRVETKNAAMHARKRMKEACQFAIERSFGNQINVDVEVVAMKKQKPLNKYYLILKILLLLFRAKGELEVYYCRKFSYRFSQKGLRVGIVDADIYGPSLPMMFDVQHYKPFLE